MVSARSFEALGVLDLPLPGDETVEISVLQILMGKRGIRDGYAGDVAAELPSELVGPGDFFSSRTVSEV